MRARTYLLGFALALCALLRLTTLADVIVVQGPARFPAGGVSYLLSEGFEGTGYENTWSESGSTIDEDYTSTVLVGSQSLRISTTTTATTVSTLGASYSTLEAYFQLRTATLYGSGQSLIQFLNSSNTVVLNCLFNSGGALVLRAAGSNPQQTTSDTMSTGTTYHVWIRYVAGTGSNAFASAEFSSTGTRAGSGTKYASISTGNATTDANKIRFGPASSVTNSDIVIDRVLVLNGSIGSNP